MNGLWVLAVICKWAGIALLALLLLVLLLALLVLFSPIRYRAEVKKEAELGGTFGVSLLLGAVRCRGAFDPENGLDIRLKALWFNLLGGEPKPEKKKKKKEKKPKKEKKKEKAGAEPPAEPQPIAAREKAAEKPPELEKTPEPKAQRAARQQGKAVRRVRLEEIEESPPDALPEDETEAFFTGEDAGEEPKKRLPPVVSALLRYKGKKEVLASLKKLLGRLLKGILPGDLSLKGTFGTGDPTTTGYLLATAGVLAAKFGDDIQVKGDFAKAGAEDVEVRVKGRIIPAYLLWAALAFLLARPVRRLLWTLWKARK